ncbi:MAG: methyltransferase domain-containing protein [Solirubrobacterales bacterium]|nr:methyltransferase domain-containing protein [Solirubrobacterales bacterium]
MPEAREIEKQQRETWERFSAGWIKWDPQVVEMLAPVGQEMIRSLVLAEDGVHLDVASGTGEPGLSIAAQMPRGRVVLTDLSEAMLAGASSKAEKLALRNVEIRVCGVDDLPFNDASFDSVSCRFGFMFFPDIRGAVSELVRVLRPGGRISTAVWAQPDGNAWATLPMGAISAEVELAAPEPDAPGLFRCAAPDSVAAILREAGLHDVAESDVRGSLEVDSGDDYWTMLTEVTAPVVAVLAGVDHATKERIRAATIEKAQAFKTNGRLSLPFHARCVVATR